MENESNTGHNQVDKIEDKLEYLFQKQKMVISQNLNAPNASKNEGENENPRQHENKMKRLYEIDEPFEGYRIFMLSSALLHEVVELQRETDWKWWKSTKGTDKQKLVEEIVDLWHFLIQLSIETGIDPDMLITKYMEKNKENIKRQELGY